MRRDDRRRLRRLAGALCLLLAFASLVAAGATLSAQTGDPAVQKPAGSFWSRLPVALPLVGLVFLVVLSAALRRGRHREKAIPAAARLPNSP